MTKNSVAALSHETGATIDDVLTLVDQLIALDSHETVIAHASDQPHHCVLTPEAAETVCSQLAR